MAAAATCGFPLGAACLMFSQTTEYALRAMACMALEPDRLMPTPLLAKLTRVPPNYLAKVLQQLAACGLITGRRGVGGGYKLVRPPAEVNLLQIVNAIGGSGGGGELKRVRTCPLGIAAHDSVMCPLHKRADAAAAAVIAIYEGTTLQDLLTDSSPNRPLCGLSKPAEVSAELTIRAASSR